MNRRDFLKVATLLGGAFLAGGPDAALRQAFGDEPPQVRGKVHGVFFSATGTTRKVVDSLAGQLHPGAVRHDIAKRPFLSRMPLAADDLAVVGVPVYNGRVPPVALQSLAKLQGSGSRAVAVYGNRDYDDALLELVDTLGANGFSVVAAAAFIGRHSIFPQVAEGRPDASDMNAVAAFAHQCADRLATTPPATTPPIKGNRPYRETQPVPLKPSIDAAVCNACGTCAIACPVKALKLDRANRRIVRRDDLCISCAACIHVCPSGAQAFRGEQYEKFGKAFAEKMSARKEPEFFL